MSRECQTGFRLALDASRAIAYVIVKAMFSLANIIVLTNEKALNRSPWSPSRVLNLGHKTVITGSSRFPGTTFDLNLESNLEGPVVTQKFIGKYCYERIESVFVRFY